MDFNSNSNREKIITIICMVGLALFILSRSCGNDSSSSNDYSYYDAVGNSSNDYSYYDAVGNKVIINLNSDRSGTIRMEYAKTSSGLEEYISKEPIACSWGNYILPAGVKYIRIDTRSESIYIRNGDKYAYFDFQDMKARDTKRGCKLN